MNAQEAHKSISYLTGELIKFGFSEAQNYPSITNVYNRTRVQFSGFQDISIALKNVRYSEIYEQLEKDKQFNVKMLDGGLLQLLYEFENDELVKHRLCYYPSPSFESFQNDPELYIDESNIYGDILMKSVLPVPVRFDYAPDDAEAVLHPASHLSLGEYKNCRIPVVSPLCPSTFINFVLSSFYRNAALEMPALFENTPLFKTIDELESVNLHLSLAL